MSDKSSCSHTRQKGVVFVKYCPRMVEWSHIKAVMDSFEGIPISEHGNSEMIKSLETTTVYENSPTLQRFST